MKRIIAALMIFAALCGTCDAGRRRVALREKRIDFRQAKLDSGVTLYRAKAFYHTAKSVNNVTGILNPANWIMGVLF